MANMHLVTGFAGREHITSIDQGLLNSYIFGDLEVVMERGNQFEASIISNNIIRVKDGDLLMQGRFARLNDDSYVDLTIDNGTQGYYRNDLIVARYLKDAITAVETVDLVVIKGENAASSPVDPAYVTGDIKSGKDFQNDVPLWRVSLNGLNVAGLTCLYSTFSNTLENHAAKHKSTGSDPLAPEDIGAAATRHNHSASDITEGTLSVARGGTGYASYTPGRLIYPSASTTLAQLAFPTVAGSVLRQGTSGAPYWTSIVDLATALGAATIATGSYTGTGTYGASNPNSITCPFVPKALFIQQGGLNNLASPSAYIAGIENKGSNISVSGNTLSWYTTASTAYASSQLNKSNVTYYWVAIG